MSEFKLIFLSALSLLCPFSIPGIAQYSQSGHRAPAPGEIAICESGNYGLPGATYILVSDISSPKSALFLGKDITLDLNGYTITYANGDYEHLPNLSFEEGIEGWDVSGAPRARIEDTKVNNNIIVQSSTAGDDFKPIRMGWDGNGAEVFSKPTGEEGSIVCELPGNSLVEIIL